MKSSGDRPALVLPADLLTAVVAAASEEQRPIDDVLRDLVERGLGERRRQVQAKLEYARGRAMGLPADDRLANDDYRRDVREKIAQGVRSLRRGEGTDSKACFAELYADLDEREQQAGS